MAGRIGCELLIRPPWLHAQFEALHDPGGAVGVVDKEHQRALVVANLAFAPIVVDM